MSHVSLRGSATDDCDRVGMRTDVPAAHPVCPRCDGPNACGPARSGSFDTRCWCEGVTVPRGLVAALEPRLRGLACLCARCIASHG